MKLTSIQTFIVLFVLFFTFSVNAQIDTKSTVNSSEDSVIYIQPKQLLADLAMITPPAGFVVSDRFNGYLHLQAGSAIIMTYIENANYIKICEGMTDEFFAKNNIVKVSDTAIESDYKVKGHMYKFSFLLNNVEYIRYMVYSGDLNNTLWLNITYPKQLEELVETELLKSIQSINLKPNSNDGK